jgi:siroheme synthase-like protein
MKKDQGITYYPVFLNIKGRKCVVVGGGQVALRKIRILLEHGADIEVISPDLCPELVNLTEGGEIRAFNREYQEEDLKNAFVTIAATDNSDINQRVAMEAQRRAVLVNVVDDAENCDFIVPSYLRRGDITIAVSSGGKSPSLARKIRSRLENELGDEYALLTNLISEVRTELKQKEIKVDGDGWQEAIELDSLLDLLKKGSKEKAKATLLSNLKTKQR